MPLTLSRPLLSAFLLSLCPVAHAQTMLLTGHVTSVTGNYVGEFLAGQEIKLSFDLTGHLVDTFGGMFPGQSFMQVKAALTVGGTHMRISDEFPTLPNIGLIFYDQPGMSGLLGTTSFFDPGGHFPGDTSSHRELRQYLYSVNDILTSLTEFPSGITMDNFYDKTGFYSREGLDRFGQHSEGRIDWEITSYTGFSTSTPLPSTPVPEPSTYGIFGVFALGGAALLRRKTNPVSALSR